MIKHMIQIATVIILLILMFFPPLIPPQCGGINGGKNISINTLQELKELCNFHTLMIMVSALHDSPVYRLKQTWAKVPPTMLVAWEDMSRLMTSDRSFVSYRLALRNSSLCVPYLGTQNTSTHAVGLHLTDLVFIDDGNPNVYEGCINIMKLSLRARVLQEIIMYQQMTYTFPVVDEVMNVLLHVQTYYSVTNEYSLYQRSKLIEPTQPK